MQENPTSGAGGGGVPATGILTAELVKKNAEMEKEIVVKMKTVRIGILLSLFTLLFGFILGCLLGQGKIKDHLKEDAQAVFDTVYKDDSVKMKKITDKS